MKTGDRVRYLATGRRADWHGKTGEIILSDLDGFVVKFDEPPGYGYSIPATSLELIMPDINIHKPLALKDWPDDKVTFIGKLENGDVFVTAENCAAEWFQFRKDGSFKASSNGSGSALRLINVPERTSGFYPLENDGNTTRVRGLISLDMAMSEYPFAKYFVEIVKIDGVPTEAHLHAR